MKNRKGITLIALVITIIILLILSGVTLKLFLDKDNIISIAQQTTKDYINKEEQEKKDLNDLYSSMIVATNEDAKVTISMEDLNKLIDKKVEEKMQTMNADLKDTQYIDTSKEIASLGGWIWITKNSSYTATEDCVVTGSVGSEENGILNILINSKIVGSVRWAKSFGWSPISYNLKKGDTIEFEYANNGKSVLVNVKVYGLKQ